MKKWLLWVITALGIAILSWIFLTFSESQTALKWPQTKGQVVSSSLFIKHLPAFVDQNPDPLRWYGADVQYKYTVGGNLYVSHRVSLNSWGVRSPMAALKVMNKYRKQHEVTVYYDPANPAKALLEPGDIGEIAWPLLIGGLLVFFGFYFLFNESIEVKPHRDDMHIRRGDAYRKQNKFHAALYEYNKYLEVNPSLAQGYKSRGELYLEQGYWDQAIANFDQASMIDPGDGRIYYNRANAYLGKRQCDKAWDDMQKAIELGIIVKPEILAEIQKGL